MKNSYITCWRAALLNILQQRALFNYVLPADMCHVFNVRWSPIEYSPANTMKRYLSLHVWSASHSLWQVSLHHTCIWFQCEHIMCILILTSLLTCVICEMAPACRVDMTCSCSGSMAMNTYTMRFRTTRLENVWPVIKQTNKNKQNKIAQIL